MYNFLVYDSHNRRHEFTGPLVATIDLLKYAGYVILSYERVTPN